MQLDKAAQVFSDCHRGKPTFQTLRTLKDLNKVANFFDNVKFDTAWIRNLNELKRLPDGVYPQIKTIGQGRTHDFLFFPNQYTKLHNSVLFAPFAKAIVEGERTKHNSAYKP